MKKVVQFLFPAAAVFLFAAYPLVFLLAKNPNYQIGPVFWGTAQTILIIAVLVWLGAGYILKDYSLSGFLVAALLFLVFSFQGIVDALEPLGLGEAIAFLVLAALIALVVWGGLKVKSKSGTLVQMAIAMGLCFLAFNAIPYIQYKQNPQTEHLEVLKQFEYQKPNPPVPLEELPDVYYIIPDMFAAPEILTNLFQYDGAGFVRELHKRGFYVAEKSTTNYVFSLLSIASSLNMGYLDGIVNLDATEEQREEVLTQMNKKNLVLRAFKEMGYTTVVTLSGYEGTDMRDADKVLTVKGSLTEFQRVLVEMTPLPWLAKKLPFFKSMDTHEQLRRTVLHYFEVVPEVARMKEPTFTFMHVLVPHWPFVFDRDGNPVTPRKDRYIAIRNETKEYVLGYREQVSFVANKILELIDSILEKSEKPPIIIVQGDHGTDALLDYYNPTKHGLIERVSILNALHLPGDGEKVLTQTMTPVNTFRRIFNLYFGTNYELLPDKNYFSLPSTKRKPSAVKSVEEITQSVRVLKGIPLE